MMNKIKWTTNRIIFILLISAGILSAGLTGLLLAPLYHWYFFREFRISRKYWSLYMMVVTGGRIFREWLRNPEYRGMFSIKLFAPPMTGPDDSKVRIRSSWNVNEDTCSGCVKCCSRLACPLMDVEQKRCLGYDSFFWRYFNCGRYPSSDKQIRYYACEKWEMIP